MREHAGLSGTTIIGVFGTNTERKQTPRVLHAMPEIIRQLNGTPVLLYLHCRPLGYWRLADIADDLGIAEHVLFPSAAFDEARGVRTIQVAPESSDPALKERSLAALSYVNRINCCDVIVNIPHSGDIEQVILEAQSCDVAIVHTDDGGIMAEAVGSGGLLLPAQDVGTGRCGERIHHVAPSDIAEAVTSILLDDQQRTTLRKAGLANAALYTWAPLRDAVCDIADRVLTR